jgi:DDE superfamily endonuclease/Tc5 transposase DNA-binding domain
MDAVDEALVYFTKNRLPLNDVAEKFGVARSTLGHRLKGRQCREKSATDRQTLSPGQEEELLKWIEYQQSTGYPPTSALLRFMASQITGVEPTRGWLRRFQLRNKELRLSRAQNLDTLRLRFSPSRIEVFFERLEKHVSHYRISSEDIWNMDEVGIHFNDMESNLPVWTLNLKGKASFGSSPDSRLVTVLESINTTGKSIPPLLISKGKHITEGQLPPDSILVPGDHLFLGKSDSAFTNSELTLAWLQQSFIPSSRRFAGGKEVWRLLILDGHASHVAWDFINTAYENHVIVLFLPSKSTNLLQPCDLNFFSVVKRKYKQALTTRFFEGKARLFWADFLELYLGARRESLTRRVCKKAFAEAGIWPFNPQKYQATPLFQQTQAREPSSSSSPCSSPPDIPQAPSPLSREMIRQLIRQGDEASLVNLFAKQADELKTEKAKNAILTFKNNQLENQLKESRRELPSRKRVRLSPNQTVLEIRASHHAAGNPQTSSPIPDDIIDSVETESSSTCSEVAVGVAR